jgi:hypothetical protein
MQAQGKDQMEVDDESHEKPEPKNQQGRKGKPGKTPTADRSKPVKNNVDQQPLDHRSQEEQNQDRTHQALPPCGETSQKQVPLPCGGASQNQNPLSYEETDHNQNLPPCGEENQDQNQDPLPRAEAGNFWDSFMLEGTPHEEKMRIINGATVDQTRQLILALLDA